MDYQKISEEVLKYLGGKENLKSYENCMTRLRVYPVDHDKIDFEAIKKLPEVMGVVNADQVQVILGPGHAQAVKESIDKIVTTKTPEVESAKMPPLNKLKAFCQKIGSIFVPLMPYFIIYGFISIGATYIPVTTQIVSQFFILLQELLMYVLIALIGYYSAKTFATNKIYNTVIAIILLILVKVVTSLQIDLNFSLAFLRYGLVLTIIVSAMMLNKVEDFLKKALPNLIVFYLLPILTITAITIATLIILPITALIMQGIIWFISFILLEKLGPIGGFVLSLLFLPTILLGVHQVLYPIHIQLLLEYGGNFLFPILATAGAGQLGMAFALFILEKNKTEKQKIAKVIPASILGMNEQLIFGVAYPRFYPFITGCIGGAFGGAFLGHLYQQGNIIMSTIIGPSGLLLLPLILNNQWLYYLLAFFISSLRGFLFPFFFGRKKKALNMCSKKKGRNTQNGENR